MSTESRVSQGGSRPRVQSANLSARWQRGSHWKLIPLLLFYLAIAITSSRNEFFGDEGRYVWFAQNLSHGFYSPTDNINLWNGPGYPLILTPFVTLGVPWIVPKLLNAVLVFLAVLYFCRALRLYTGERESIGFAYVMGVYPPLSRYIPYMLTESLAVFLICGFGYHFCRLHRARSARWFDFAVPGVYLGYLALTKILFGYIILAGMLFFLLLCFRRRTPGMRRSFLVCSIAFLCCLPYLSYTHSLTRKPLYWGNSAGIGLYWLSSPMREDLGDWFPTEQVLENPQEFGEHAAFLARVEELPSIQRDEEMKSRAIRNIRNHPRTFLRNWAANVGRLVFNYPYARTTQKLSTYFYFIPNMFLVVMSALLGFVSLTHRRLFPHEIKALMLLALTSLAATSLLSGVSARQFMVIVPLLLLWMGFTLTQLVRVEIRARNTCD